MADFSFLSDTDESAVDEILSEAADLVALKQISAINLSGVSDSVLPQHLESLFRRLKTFPSARPPTPKLTDSTRNEPDSGSGSPKTPDMKPVSTEKKSRSGSSRRRLPRSPSSSSSSGSSNSWLESKNSPKSKAEKGNESDRRSGSISPPPKNTGCLWCSPKRALKKMSFSKRSGGGGGLDWGGNDSVLKDLGVGSLSRREQEKILKRAAKEEMKINAEAEKIVKLAKHVSARMEAFELEDDDDLRYK